MEYTDIKVGGYYYLKNNSYEYYFECDTKPKMDNSNDYCFQSTEGHIWVDQDDKEIIFDKDYQYFDECDEYDMSKARELTFSEIAWLKACKKANELVSKPIVEATNYSIF